MKSKLCQPYFTAINVINISSVVDIIQPCMRVCGYELSYSFTVESSAVWCGTILLSL